MTKNSQKTPKIDTLIYLVGKRKAQLIRYTFSQKVFYQAQAAHDLHWNISTTQYHLKNFVKHHLLISNPTSYKTYYQLNPRGFPKLFS